MKVLVNHYNDAFSMFVDSSATQVKVMNMKAARDHKFDVCKKINACDDDYMKHFQPHDTKLPSNCDYCKVLAKQLEHVVSLEKREGKKLSKDSVKAVVTDFCELVELQHDRED